MRYAMFIILLLAVVEWLPIMVAVIFKLSDVYVKVNTCFAGIRSSYGMGGVMLAPSQIK